MWYVCVQHGGQWLGALPVHLIHGLAFAERLLSARHVPGTHTTSLHHHNQVSWKRKSGDRWGSVPCILVHGTFTNLLSAKQVLSSWLYMTNLRMERVTQLPQGHKAR